MPLLTTRTRVYSPSYLPGVGNQKDGRKSKKWVLVMDDDSITRQVICHMLESNGYRTYGTHDGDEAISSYLKAKDCGYAFDAVVLDLNVPHGKSGKEAMREMLAVDPDVRAILVTGDSTDPVAIDFSAFGFKGMLCKPFTPEQLDETLQVALEGKSRASEKDMNC